MALHGGPLCEEPVMGVCYIVESIRFKEDGQDKTNASADVKNTQVDIKDRQAQAAAETTKGEVIAQSE